MAASDGPRAHRDGRAAGRRPRAGNGAAGLAGRGVAGRRAARRAVGGRALACGRGPCAGGRRGGARDGRAIRQRGRGPGEPLLAGGSRASRRGGLVAGLCDPSARGGARRGRAGHLPERGTPDLPGHRRRPLLATQDARRGRLPRRGQLADARRGPPVARPRAGCPALLPPRADRRLARRRRPDRRAGQQVQRLRGGGRAAPRADGRAAPLRPQARVRRPRGRRQGRAPRPCRASARRDDRVRGLGRPGARVQRGPLLAAAAPGRQAARPASTGHRPQRRDPRARHRRPRARVRQRRQAAAAVADARERDRPAGGPLRARGRPRGCGRHPLPPRRHVRRPGQGARDARLEGHRPRPVHLPRRRRPGREGAPLRLGVWRERPRAEVHARRQVRARLRELRDGVGAVPAPWGPRVARRQGLRGRRVQQQDSHLRRRRGFHRDPRAAGSPLVAALPV